MTAVYASGSLACSSDRVIKAKLNKPKNIFNADPAIQFGTTEYREQCVQHNGAPATLIPARASEMIIGTDGPSFDTESATQFRGHGDHRRPNLKPKYVEVAHGRLMQRSNSPAAQMSVSQADYRSHGVARTVKANNFQHRSDDIFSHAGESHYQTETHAQFVPNGGRPASSQRPPQRHREDGTFYGETSYKSSFKGHAGTRSLKRGELPRAARSEIGEKNLICHIGADNRNFLTEARGTYVTKQGTRAELKRSANEGIGFGEYGSKDDRDFSTEVNNRFTKLNGKRAERSKLADHPRYNPVPDDRDFLTEAQAQHTHGGPPAQVYRAMQESMSMNSASRSQSRQSTRSYTKFTQPSTLVSARPPSTAVPSARQTSYIPALSQSPGPRTSSFMRSNRHPHTAHGDTTSGIGRVSQRERANAPF
jgi:hypothetical protein